MRNKFLKIDYFSYFVYNLTQSNEEESMCLLFLREFVVGANKQIAHRVGFFAGLMNDSSQSRYSR